ncbi:hypothetical protein PILCRDRAFT_814765 [Piloderma croceum F 1598]|uniref:Uncharacterized protein n=1 Tax=Piloderma croceum (strain F 1598) TaxID=765440 RepID=A0A0C3CC76_PILCF|nr:hypothetical protein PILCRDRAFT_814765 [Piloderma croceum F 1598]
MKKTLFALKSRITPSHRKKNETRQNWSSPALDNARTVCQLLSNLGSGGINVPGLQAAGLIAVQIIDIIKKTKGNQTDCEDVVTRIMQLLDPIAKTLQNQNTTDIDLRLTEDLRRFTEFATS